MVREFKLINEKGQEFSLMDIKEYCLLTEPTGLGLTYSTEYEQLNNVFISNLRKIEQGSINGTLNFCSYDNFKKFIDFVEKSEELKIAYSVPFETGSKEYFRDIQLQQLDKSEKQENGIISENVSFDCLSLWYEEKKAVYQIETVEDEIRWDFSWDSRFVDLSSRELQFINEGHVDAPVEIEIDGDVENPVLELYVENELYQSVEITNHILQYQKLKYGTLENDFYIKKELQDGTETSLFNLDTIDFANDNVIRFPKGKSCTLKFSADNEILSARVKVYVFYKAI